MQQCIVGLSMSELYGFADAAQTRESVAEPFQPVRIYVKNMSKLYIKRQFWKRKPFQFR